MKFLMEVGKHPTAEEEELSEASRAKVEAAVAELQNRIQKKADVDDLERITQSTQSVKDACEKMESNMIELQSQLKRLSAGSRRASRVSLTGSLIPPGQLQMFIPETKLNSLEDLDPKLLDELTKDMKEAIEKHNKELEKVQQNFGLYGRTILKLSGHQEDQPNPGTMDPTDKLAKIFESFGDGSPLSTPSSNDKAVHEAISSRDQEKQEVRDGKMTLDSPSATETMGKVDCAPAAVKKDVLVGTVDMMDDDSVVRAIDESLKANKFEPKENAKTISRLCQELEKLTLKLQQLDTTLPSLKDGLALKAEKRDLQKLARFVKEQLERPENAIFTGKPLHGFKCMSCDHSIQKLSRVTGDHKPTNRMPPQILPMLSAERIFSLERRPSNNACCPATLNTPQTRKSWVGAPTNFGPEVKAPTQNGIMASPRDKRLQKIPITRKASPKKSAAE